MIMRENGRQRVYRVGHVACGLGSGALGFRQASPKVGNLQARFETAGGIDIDPGALANFEHLTGVKGTHLDLFSRDQYVAYHGHEPPADWREATPADMRAVFGHLDVAFSSPPCRGLTSLLDPKHVGSARYEALNQLTLRCYWLLLEAYRDDPIRILLLENVPGLATRGRHLLDQIYALLRHYGYAVAEDTHDVGPIGGLAQHRKRFLMVARHRELVPPFLYQPERKRMKTVGEVLGALPPPGDPRGGLMHRVPNLKWRTWTRLAFIEAGSDWRSLHDLAVEDGRLRDWAIRPYGGAQSGVEGLLPQRAPHNQVMGVRDWNGTTGVVQGASRPHNGAFCVADPRYGTRTGRPTLGVRDWGGTTGAVTGQTHPTNGAFSVGDPRQPPTLPDARYFEIVAREHLGAVDPRAKGTRGGRGKYRVTRMDEASGTVISSSTTGEGAYAVADGRLDPRAHHDAKMPGSDESLLAVIIARDGTWHRPFTTLDLAALQSLVDPDEVMAGTSPLLLGSNQEDLRLWIGNAVPAASAKALGEVVGEVLLMAETGTTFQLSSREIWVRPAALALTVDTTAPGGSHHVESMLG
jgi:site-specific DNA-cytosine methylase